MKVRAASLAGALLALVAPKLRPVRYDTSKLRGLLGAVERTPLAEAVSATLDWLVEEDRS